MILIDFSNVIVGSIMVAHKVPDEERFSEDFIRHLVLNSLRSYRNKYKTKYGELVICTDFHSSWRKDVFPFYKAHRKVAREKQKKDSGLDWSALFDTISRIIVEIDTFFPYKVIRVAHAEGDDVIAVLARAFNEPTLIVSSDKDFTQLHKHKWVKQWSPLKSKMVNGIDPYKYLKEHTIRGDKGDGIPNALSADDCFVEGVRQKAISKKKVATWLELNPKDFNDDLKRGWDRNKILIDFDCIPKKINDTILEQYNREKEYQRGQLMNYFIKNRLKYLMENMGDFTK